MKPTPTSSRRLRSEDGVIAFSLARVATGVHVERIELRKGRARIVHSTVFADDKSFERWCDSDSVRFDYPLVYVSLKRDGNELFRPTDEYGHTS
jgi:hypothetical protein